MSRIYVPNKTFNAFTIDSTQTIDYLPEIDARWADEVAFQVMVEDVNGSPTAWQVKPYFQEMIGTSQAQEEWSLQFSQSPTVRTLNAQDDVDLLPDGDWPLFTEGNLTDLPLLTPVTRRVRGGIEVRLCIDVTLTGGTSPDLLLTINGPTIRG